MNGITERRRNKSMKLKQWEETASSTGRQGCCCCLVAKSSSTLGDPMDCSPWGYSVHGISQARILEWTATSYFRGSSRSRDWICISCTTDRFFTTEPLHWATWEAHAQGYSRHQPTVSCFCEIPTNAILWKTIHALKCCDTGRKGRGLVK